MKSRLSLSLFCPLLAEPLADLLRPVVFGALALLLLAGLVLWLRGLRQPVQPLDYDRQETLFTPAEIRFLLALQDAVEGELVIVGKVRLADLIRPAEGMERGQWQIAFNKIRAKHLDFVLLDPSDFAPLLAIELDDSSHERADRIERDDFVDFACRRAGLPLLRFPVAARYERAELRREISRALRAAK